MITNELVKSLIPNVVFETEGEETLLSKLAPQISIEKSLIESNISSRLEEVTSQCPSFDAAIVYRAIVKCIPALDITLTPSGFGVVSTQTVAPASKERVAALTEAYQKKADDALSALIDELFTVPAWEATSQYAVMTLTLVHNTRDTDPLRLEGEDSIECFKRCLRHAVAFEKQAKYFVGESIMVDCEAMLIGKPTALPVSTLPGVALSLKEAELQYLKSANTKYPGVCPPPHEIWHILEDTIRAIKDETELYHVWQAEAMCEDLSTDPSKSFKGAYFL